MGKFFIILLITTCFLIGAILLVAYNQNINLQVVSEMIIHPNTFRTFRIENKNMFPTLTEERYYFVKKVSEITLFSRGDIVVSGSPFDHQFHVKRVIGLPGEDIVINSNKIYINNQLLRESYLPDIYLDTQPGRYLPEGQHIQIPKNSLVLLNDNRQEMDDSRTWGFIPRTEISYKLIACYRNCKGQLKI